VGSAARTRLDELPNFSRVARARLSLIRAAAGAPELEEELERRIPITAAALGPAWVEAGWAQVKLPYTILSGRCRPETQLYDLFLSLRKQAIWLDLLILFKTIKIRT